MSSEPEKAAQSTLEQATAAWINHLNQQRLDALVAALRQQDVNLADAMGAINAALGQIDVEIVTRNRGGLKGMHGFIAEVAEVGVSNARNLIVGRKATASWVNNNGAADLVRGGVAIQQKFVFAGGQFGLDAVAEHLGRYPDFVALGGKYQIPADHYETVKALALMSEGEASRLVGSGAGPSYRQWTKVQAFFATGDVPLESLEPSHLDYGQVQRGTYATTLEEEGDALRAKDQAQRDSAYQASKPSLAEGAQAAAGSAAIEGGAALVMAVVAKRRSGVAWGDFTREDWTEVAVASGVGAVRGGLRGASVYVLSNFTATPAAVASGLFTASVAIAEQANHLRTGRISELEFIEKAEAVALETAVSALASVAGQALIPIPVLGAVIGNTAGMIAYRAVGTALRGREAELLAAYAEAHRAQTAALDAEYQALVASLESAMETYLDLLDRAFDPDPLAALEGSIELARSLGVEDVLDSDEKVLDFFTG